MKRHKHKRSPVPLKAMKTGEKRKPFSRITAAVVHGEREYSLHPTKGYRSHRA